MNRVILSPSQGEPCGNSAYVENLLRYMPKTTVITSWDQIKKPDVLYIQHGECFFKDSFLNVEVPKLLEAGIKVIVTVHDYTKNDKEWLHKTINIVHSETQQRMFSEMGVESHFIPLGCQTWKFPRKKFDIDNIVIGGTGLFTHYKQFQYVANTLRNKKCTYKVWAHTNAVNRSVNAEYGFYAGGNIVRNSDYIPEEKELCRQLAEECDILVYWYKDIEGQASAAARLGLSTGVPCIFKTGARMLREGIPDGAALYSDNLLLAINHLIVYENEREKLSKNAQEFCANNSYEIAAKKYLELT